MADPASPIQRLQRDALEPLRDRGLLKDEALVARLAALGCDVDRTTIVRWRAGQRTAPLGVLLVALGFLGDEERLEYLAAVLEGYGLRAVPLADPGTDDRGLTDRVLEVGGLVGQLQSEARAAMADGHVDEVERAALSDLARHLEQAAAEIRGRLS